MTDQKLHELLDQTRFGDVLTLAHSNGKHTASISGPVLSDQAHDPCVGIHLLDGDPHIVRTPAGVVWAPVVHAALHRSGRLIAKWEAADYLEAQQTEASLRRGLADITAGRTVDLGSFAQPEPEQLGGEGATSDYTPTAEDVESCFVGEYDPETRSRAFHRWLASIRAEAWDEAATEARDLGWLHDDAHADVVARNPYSKEQP